jgi:hypothetical protein
MPTMQGFFKGILSMQDMQDIYLMVKGEGGREGDAHLVRTLQENLFRCKACSILTLWSRVKAEERVMLTR